MTTSAAQIRILLLLFRVALFTNMPRSTGTDDNKLEHTAADEDETSLFNGPLTEISTTYGNTTYVSYEIPYSNKNISCISIASPESKLSLIFTQGAGGSIESPAVTNFAEGFSELKKIVCFEGRSNLQSRTAMFKTVIEQHHCDVIGGRSLGSRAAITTSKEMGGVKALILVSYPLKGAKGDIRDQLLLDIDDSIDVLFVIGDKDSMCDLNELKQLMNRMVAKTWIIVVSNADHGMVMRPSKATAAVGKMVGKIVARWIDERDNALRNCEVRWDETLNDVVVGPWN